MSMQLVTGKVKTTTTIASSAVHLYRLEHGRDGWTGASHHLTCTTQQPSKSARHSQRFQFSPRGGAARVKVTRTAGWGSVIIIIRAQGRGPVPVRGDGQAVPRERLRVGLSLPSLLGSYIPPPPTPPPPHTVLHLRKSRNPSFYIYHHHQQQQLDLPCFLRARFCQERPPTCFPLPQSPDRNVRGARRHGRPRVVVPLYRSTTEAKVMGKCLSSA